MRATRGGGLLLKSRIAPSVSDNTDLQLNDLFWTLQGEGHFSGRRALFIRLPFCNYDCPWCDTEYNSFKKWTEQEFVKFIDKETSRFAVITGGEPLAHKHLPRILKILKDKGFYIACETNGSYPAPPEIDFVTVSPKPYTKKKFEAYYIHPELYDRASEWKYVVDTDFNFELLSRHAHDPEAVHRSLSPEYNNMQKNTQKIIGFIQENPQWRLSLQTHNWIDIP